MTFHIIPNLGHIRTLRPVYIFGTRFPILFLADAIDLILTSKYVDILMDSSFSWGDGFQTFPPSWKKAVLALAKAGLVKMDESKRGYSLTPKGIHAMKSTSAVMHITGHPLSSVFHKWLVKKKMI